MDDEISEDAPPQWWKMSVLIVAVAAFAVLIGVMFTRAGGDPRGGERGAIALDQLTGDRPSTHDPTASTALTTVADSIPSTHEATAASSRAATPMAGSETARSMTATSPTATATTAETNTTSVTTTETSGATAANAAPATTVATAGAAVSAQPESAAPAAGEVGGQYPTSPDGSPLPLLVIFDTDTVTVSGQVPSQAAKDRLAALAIANSQFPDAVLVDNMLINPAVPITVGVRVIELNSARFPEGTADILPAHAAELDRVVNIMNALPNISVLVIGHADQRGDDVANFAISDERARAVVNYLLYLGISPTRLASRAAGESDLLTLANDDASLALNRRTEFVFSGLLIE